MSLLEVTQVVAGYGETEILHGVSLAVQPGEIVAIIGPNGSGKSTLMKSIVGLLRPKRGQVHFQGKDITGMPPEEIVGLGLCYVHQTSNIFPSLSIHENLEMGAFLRTDDFRQRLTDDEALSDENADGTSGIRQSPIWLSDQGDDVLEMIYVLMFKREDWKVGDDLIE